MNHNPYTAPTASLQETGFQSLPLNLNVTMKLIALAPQFYLYDLQGKEVGFIKQKLFKLKEAIEVYSDSTKTNLRYKISADRVIDFSANYHFGSVRDGLIGRTKQHGMKSLWRTEFEILDDSGTRFFIRLQNPMAQFLEGLLGMIPVIGDILSMLSGYFLNPTYEVTTIGGDEVATMKKLPALWEGKYEIRASQKVNQRDSELIALSLLTLILMQRASDG
ncbi:MULTISPECIES: hypothetical protein [unclassified Moraxella]|uniref:hypothetical protein n=1 Tax=unclassified Moraxella TaxID=2685852 RepID=UPI003AF52B20